MKPSKRSAAGGRRPEVSIIVVAYNDPQDLDLCLASIREHESKANPDEIIVVDNSTVSDVRVMIRNRHPEIRYIHNSNTGFGAANNRGASSASGDILFLLNPDAYLIEPLLDSVANRFSAEPSLGALGVPLVYPSGSSQQSFFWVDAGGVAKSLLQHLLIRMNIFLPKWMCTSGAALFLRREAFEAVGGFDSAMFLYNEEADLWRRLKAQGWNWGFYDGCKVCHVGGGSTSNSVAATAHRLESLRYYCEKYSLDYKGRLRKESRYIRFAQSCKYLLSRKEKNAANVQDAIIREYLNASVELNEPRAD